ncbi:MAG: Saccharopine dehydrogenase [Bacteroidota bacterium]|nr:Saccharopine dehydrogenase [Bacteroidota bacterium]
MQLKEGLLIYGCYGYTGKLICDHAVKSGMKPVLAGRDKEKTEALANELKLEYRVFDVSDENVVAENLKDFKVVLHCAGPFMFTAQIMAKACIKAKTHYLDITGEILVFEQMFKLSDAATEAGVLLMPGVGFDVVPTDCLALYLKDKLQGADSLELGLYQKGGKLSHGTAITIAENLGESGAVRRNGKLEAVANGTLTRLIRVDQKERNAVAIPWGDVSTAYRTTKIPNITVYNILPQKLIEGMKMSNYFGFFFRSRMFKNYVIKKIKKRPAGPSDEERKTAKSVVWGEVKNPLGASKRAILELPEGYTLTAWTAIKIAQNILQKSPQPGTRTPAAVFGADFILQFEGVTRTDV